MKKSNRYIVISFLMLIAVFLTITACKRIDTPSVVETIASTSSTETTESTTILKETSTAPIETTANAKQSNLLSNALFIGDSRAVGISEYANLKGVDFFTNVGMSVYNIHDKKLSVPTVGKVTLLDLLENKKYDKIYIMLGINEVGYDRAKTMTKYQNLISEIQAKQPNALIFLQANLHVTKERSNRDKVINNTQIDAMNLEISKLADHKTVFYMDGNVLFDDGNGNLSAEKTGDNAHLYAKYYAQWGSWICEQTRQICKEI